MEIKTCEERVLADYDELVEIVEQLREENKRLEGLVDFLLGRISELERFERAYMARLEVKPSTD